MDLRCFRFRFSAFSSLAVTLIAANAPFARAQQTTGLSGTVEDPTQARIPAATVRLLNMETHQLRTTETDSEGRYQFALVPAGRFEIRVGKDGFKDTVRQGLDLATGQQAFVQVELLPGSVSEQVLVTGNPVSAEVSAEQTDGLVTGEEIRDLPLNGRGYDQLLTLNPGIVNYTSQRTGGVGTSNSTVGNAFAVDGRRPQENVFLLDGVEYTGASGLNQTPGGTSSLLLGVSSLREFNVLANTYGAAYGKRPGAQVLLVDNSGSNQVHGSVYEYLRNSDFDARNYFDQGSVPEFQRNQFGASLGGPLRRDQSFLFGNYEGFRQKLDLSDVTLVPDNNARNGIATSANGTLTHVGLGPGVAPLLALWPVANGPELGLGIAEAFSHPQQTIHEDFGTVRLDERLRQNDTLAATYLVDDSADNTPTANPITVDNESEREQVLSLRETHVHSSQLVNLATAGYSRANYFFNALPSVAAPSFLAGRPVGVVTVGGSATPNTSSSITSAGTNTGANHYSIRNLFTEADTISYTHGRHSVSAGVWFERVQFNDDLALSQYGQATFSSLQSFLSGTVATFTAVPSPTAQEWRSLESAAFAEDRIRLAPRLAVTLGFRYEGTNGWNEANGRASTFITGANGILQTTPVTGSSLFTINRARFLPQPRVGFSWDVFGTAATVVHGGFGIYNDLQDALGYRADQNAPFNTTVTLRNIPLTRLPLVPGQAVIGGLVAPNGIQQDLYTPTVLSYTLQLEQTLAPHTTLTLAYIGSHGYHETSSADLNQALPILCPSPSCPVGLPAGTIYHPAGEPLANPALGSGWTWISSATSSYNSLQADFRKRLSNGLDLRVVYTFAKSLDDGDSLNASGAANAPGLAEDARHLALDHGPSTFDVRDAVSVNSLYPLPFGLDRALLAHPGRVAGLFLNDWELSGIYTLQTGYPFTPELSFNPSNNGDTTNPVRPSLNPNFHGPVIAGGPMQYFNPNAFAVPAPGTYGNVSRDSFTGPGVSSLDMSLLKDARLTEALRFQLRGDVFNLLNHANFNTPNLVVFTTNPTVPKGTITPTVTTPSSSAGVITSTSTTSRQIQISAKFIW